jgi:hypothetical protein
MENGDRRTGPNNDKTKPKKNMKQVNEACNQQAMEASERAKRLAMTNTA